MKKFFGVIVIASLLISSSIAFAAPKPAVKAKAKTSVSVKAKTSAPVAGAKTGHSVTGELALAGMFGIRGQYSLHKESGQPISVQAFFRTGTILGGSLSGLGVVGMYNFKMDGPITPYIGVGIHSISASGGIVLPGGLVSGTGLHLTLGASYVINPDWDVELNWNGISSIALGASYNI